MTRCDAWIPAVLIILSLLMAAGCATFRSPDANGPRAIAKPYPLEIQSDATRFAETSVAWNRLVQSSSANRVEPDLNPITATISSLPRGVSGTIFLPPVGSDPDQNEGETRESLRRFIRAWQPLIGADLSQLSLVERSDEKSGTRTARYEQRPFRYALRGAFGRLVIKFADDRRVLDISSTCIPDADRIQSAIANLSPQYTRDQILPNIRGRAVTVTNNSGTRQTVSVPPNESMEVGELVIYARASDDQTNTIEAHLAWEILWPNGPIKTLYVDAISDEVIAGS